MYYYGFGWWKWYKKSEFEKQLEVIYKDEYRSISLLLHGADPFTPKVDERKYELLLQMTHEAITNHLEQEKWKDKLTPFSGPQCHEDRGNKIKSDYNPNLNKKIEKDVSSYTVNKTLPQEGNEQSSTPRENDSHHDGVQGVVENDFQGSFF